MTQTLQYCIDAISLGSLYALLALGIGFIFGVARVVNFAHGEFIMVAAYVLLIVASWAWPLAILVVALATMFLAVASERLIFRPARGSDPSTLLALSLGLSLLLQNIVLLIAGSRAKTLNFGSWLTKPAEIFGLRIARLDIVTIVVTVALLVGLGAFLRRTLIGLQLRAASEDFSMARLLGVRANRVVATAFALSGLLAAISGVLIASQSGSLTPTIGITPVLIAFTATVIGGMGSLSGSIVGGFVLGTFTVFLQVVLPESAIPYRESMVFAGVIAILLFRPGGIIPATNAAERI